VEYAQIVAATERQFTDKKELEEWQRPGRGGRR
jgi:hypothetical protein